MNAQDLMKMTLAAVGGIGDIFTDAPESAAAVLAAENLRGLASMLSNRSTIVTTGGLLADGETVCQVDVHLDGSLYGSIPEDFDTSGRRWEVVLKSGPTLPVLMFAGESSDDESWVIEDTDTFYRGVLDDLSD